MARAAGGGKAAPARGSTAAQTGDGASPARGRTPAADGDGAPPPAGAARTHGDRASAPPSATTAAGRDRAAVTRFVEDLASAVRLRASPRPRRGAVRAAAGLLPGPPPRACAPPVSASFRPPLDFFPPF